MRIFSVYIILILALVSFASAQDLDFDKERIVNTILESANISDEDLSDEAYISELRDTLNYYIDNPININTATYTDFEKLSFISPIYINAILNYRSTNGEFRNINELNLIDIIDDNSLELIKHFFTTVKIEKKEFNLIEAIENASQEVFSSYYKTLKKAYGYKINSGYLGPNFGLRLFYRLRSPDHFYVNLQLNKVPGAPFGKGTFASGYVLLKNLGIFKSVHVGDYQLQFGQGLVFWGGYSLNKSYDPVTVIKAEQEDTMYNSSLSYGFNRGLSLLILLKDRWSFRPFFSYRGIDAKLTRYNGAYRITSISRNSYYRSRSEIDLRDTAHELIAGLNTHYTISQNLNIGLSISRFYYSYDFFHLTYPYKLLQNYDQVKNYVSFTYNYQNKNYMIFGESSTLNFKEMALLLGTSLVLDPKLILSFVYRNFSRGYMANYGHPISEGSSYNDEAGLYSGLKFIISKKLQFNIFIDTFKFSWLKYQVDAPSDGIEVGALINYNPFKHLSTSLRYKFKTKAINNSLSQHNPIQYYKKHSLELNNLFKITESLMVKTYIEASKYNYETGIYLGQELRYRPFDKTDLGLRYGLFSTDSYNSRIYISEYFIPYSWPFVMLYNKGSRLSLFIKHNLNNKMNIYFLYSAISYKDVNKVGSGLSEIKGNIKPYMKIQLIYKLQ